MKKIILLLALYSGLSACAQKSEDIITKSEVLRIENVLASDEMKGRRTGSPEIDKAALFIADEFKKAGLQPMGDSHLQEFAMVRPKFISVKAEIDDAELDPKNVIVVTSATDLKVNEKMGYRLRHFNSSNIKDGASLNRAARAAITAKENSVVFVDTSFSKIFPRLAGLKRQIFKSPYSTIFILGSYQPKEFNIKAEHTIEESSLKNVVGLLPGKSKKAEYVIFSAHYDHIGIGKPLDGDSIYNGANDDAAGTTAVILLAQHYKKLANNERTLVFVAFTAEEVGGFGAQYFSQQLAPDSIAAMFNIEMIGTESKWGRNSAFITGFEKSSMGPILQEELKGSSFTFHPDPYPDQQLFYRSDNATLARLGVPAHTISTSKMDSEPNYHKPSDEVETLDLDNMTEIIKAIAKSAGSIVSGKQTPSRVALEN
ncbi:MAG TPA: M28 family peptidase [Flavisolibacter sp.]|nr:M28 family peptidase [Flavisolibacter sp.]